MESLEQIRNRLLDLTARNRLLNFSHNRGGCVRIIDELPDKLAHEFLKGEPFVFLPLAEPQRQDLIDHGFIELDQNGNELQLKPLPSATQWARLNGLCSDYDVPALSDSQAGRHNDRQLQTLLYPRELENQLRRIRANATSAIEESGTNILFLAMGFLQWYDKDNQDAERLAPLYLIPVKIERGIYIDELGTYAYQVSYTSEDIVANLSLREKLTLEYGLSLPELSYDCLPEDYFNQVETQIVQHQPRWQLRRFVTLAMFDFGKLLMYLDLAPDHWPDGPGNISNHPIVSAMFGQNEVLKAAERAGDRSTEHDIDDIADALLRYPLIDDADSSQHSAMIDALDGKNLVIEGPPGSGKSQTITNLIAAAISRGQSVLFVAEKMAALQVVQSRLNKAGLADFCLELHSHKTQKKLVFEQLKQRIDRQAHHQQPQSLEQDIEHYHQLRNRLKAHVELVNSQWQDSGRTIADILTSAATLQTCYGELDWQQVNLMTLSAQPQQAIEVDKALQSYVIILSNLKNQMGGQPLNTHPWYGAYNAQMNSERQAQVFHLLEGWQKSLLSLGQEIDSLTLKFSMFGAIETLADTAKAIESLNHPIVVNGNEITEILQALDESNRSFLSDYLSRYTEARAGYHRLRESLTEQLLQEGTLVERVQSSLDSLKQSLRQPDTRIYAVVALLERLKALQNTVRHISECRDRVVSQQQTLAPLLTINVQGLQNLESYLQHFDDLKPSVVAMRSNIFEQDELDTHLPKLTALLNKAKPIRESLKDSFELVRLMSVSDLKQIHSILAEAGFFKWFSSDWRKAKKALLSMAKGFSPKLKMLQCHLPELIAYQEAVEAIQNEPAYERLLGPNFKGIDTPIEEINTLRQWYKGVRQSFGVGFGDKVAFADALFNTPEPLFKGLAIIAQSGTLQHLAQWRESSEQLSQSLHMDFILEKHTDLLSESDGIGKLVSIVESALQIIQPCLKSDLGVNHLASLLQELRLNQTQAKALNKDAALNTVIPQEYQLGLEDRYVTTAQRLRDTMALDKAIAELPSQVIASALRHNANVGYFDVLKREFAALKSANELQLNMMTPFAEAVGLDIEDWHEGYNPKVTALIKKNAKALGQTQWLVSWIDFLRVRMPLQQQGLVRLLHWCESEKIDPEQLLPLYQAILSEHWARDIQLQHTGLAHFSSAEQDAIRQQFITVDNKLKELMRQWVASQAVEQGKAAIVPGNSGAKVSDLTEMKLIENEVSKKIRHISIRQLLNRAGTSVKALKPCFLMSPHSVAQYLAPGQFEFDLVVMDEASQIKPEDALATIARGRQLVVVGDPKQLPPTSFFEKAIDIQDKEVTQVEQAESILDMSALLFAKTRLRWHYRSRHQSLIAFSNQHFYQNDLVLFPSPHGQNDSFGVKFNYISHGRYHKQKNLEEAKTVAESVRHHLLNRPDESLGVVAMSATQSGLIERQIESLSKQDKTFREVLIANNEQDEPLFVKNLENVQGDERSVIFISFTYGPEGIEGDKMAQRFGPINSASGDRRLNVLFTRAKKRMHIFSSMLDSHVLPKTTSSKGVHLLKAFLTYAEQEKHERTLVTSNVAQNAFQESIGRALNQAGYDYVVNLGVAGYFVEIAVVDPKNSGQFLLAIESDGENYFSAKTVRDRDRLRLAVLESLGWEVIRIWSAQWYKNAGSQIDYILERLQHLGEKSMALGVDDVSEMAQIDAMVLQDKVEHQAIAEIVQSDDSLAQKLQRLGREVIDIALPNCAEGEKLLRPSMIETFCSLKPLSHSEFMDVVPVYLRLATSAEQLAYVEQVLALIGQCEEG